jgi:hypothetical protein
VHRSEDRVHANPKNPVDSICPFFEIADTYLKEVVDGSLAFLERRLDIAGDGASGGQVQIWTTRSHESAEPVVVDDIGQACAFGNPLDDMRAGKLLTQVRYMKLRSEPSLSISMCTVRHSNWFGQTLSCAGLVDRRHNPISSRRWWWSVNVSSRVGGQMVADAKGSSSS